MRDLALTGFVFALLPFVLARPHWGILLWTWIGLMNPHRLTWGFAFHFPFAVIVGLVTMIGILVSKEPKRLPLDGPVIALMIFIVWMTLATVLSLYPGEAWPQWWKVMKIQLFIFLTLIVMQQRDRIQALVWVSTFSIAFYGIKGGIYTLMRGGEGMVLGPSGGFIAGNTEISLALTMTVPFMRYLQLQSPSRWVRWGLGIAMALVAVAVLGSYSRGGLLAISAMGVVFLLKTRKKFLIGLVLLALVPGVLAVMPERWYDRMRTIETYEQDTSATKRLNSWAFAYNLAKDRPLTGGGFETFQPLEFARYAPSPELVYDAHSIWFEVLAEQGFVGVVLFLLVWLLTWQMASRVARRCRGRDDLRWASDLVSMVQVSMVGYWVGGTFLGLAYWDYPYLLMVIVVLCKLVVTRELKAVPSVTPAATAVAASPIGMQEPRARDPSR